MTRYFAEQHSLDHERKHVWLLDDNDLITGYATLEPDGRLTDQGLESLWPDLEALNDKFEPDDPFYVVEIDQQGNRV